MEHLTTAFQALLTMALAALPVLAAVLAARLLLWKAPRRPSPPSASGRICGCCGAWLPPCVWRGTCTSRMRRKRLSCWGGCGPVFMFPSG